MAWATILLAISAFTVIIAGSEFKDFGGFLTLALIGLVLFLILEAFHLMSKK